MPEEQYRVTVNALPQALRDMAALVEDELRLPESEQVSLLHLHKVMRHFVADAMIRRIARAQPNAARIRERHHSARQGESYGRNRSKIHQRGQETRDQDHGGKNSHKEGSGE